MCTTVGLDDAVPVTVPFEETARKRLDALPPPLSSSGPVRHSGTDQGQRRRRRQPKRAESSRPLPHRTKRGPPTAPRRAQGSRVEDQIPPPSPPCDERWHVLYTRTTRGRPPSGPSGSSEHAVCSCPRHPHPRRGHTRHASMGSSPLYTMTHLLILYTMYNKLTLLSFLNILISVE